MTYPTPITKKLGMLLLFCTVLGLHATFGQEEAGPELGSKSTYHNQLFFNRYLINPTFSLVRENKSYINILHRNQYATFEDNDQNYFLGFSNKLNDRTALGISVYSQWSGVVQEFGFNANYASAVKLGDKSKLTFGTNITYFTEGLDKNRVIVAEEDNKLQESKKESQIAVQPGVTLSVGQFDFGLYAEDLFKYNQTTNSFLTNLSTKSVKASLQYTYEFMANGGFFADARLMPLAQVGQNEDGSLAYVGSVLLDLPDYGWFQTNFDDSYGLSLGLGFNLSKRMSLGYLLEKDLLQDDADLGWNHEVTLAYTLGKDTNKKALFADADGSEDQKIDRIVRNYEEQILALKEEARKNNKSNTDEVDMALLDEIDAMDEADANALAYENRLVLDELMFRQDSIDAARTAAFDKRLESLVDVLRDEIKRNMGAPEQDLGTANNPVVASNYTEQEVSKIKDAALKATESIAKTPEKKDVVVAEATTAPKKVEKMNSVLTDTEAVAVAKTPENNSIKPQEEEYTRTTKFEDVSKVLGEIITKPAVTANASPETIKNEVKMPIKVLKQADLVGVKSGYYVIANVFKTRKYLSAVMEDLKGQGLDARYFYNKENGLHYVYLADFSYKEDAKTAYVSNLNGKYNEEKWIMQVDNTSAIVDNLYEDQ